MIDAGGVKTASWWLRVSAILLLLAVMLGGGYGFNEPQGWERAIATRHQAVEAGSCPPPRNCPPVAEEPAAVAPAPPVAAKPAAVAPEPAGMNVQEWLYGVFEWLGITDPLAKSVGVGVVAGLIIASALSIALRLVLGMLAGGLSRR